MHPEGLDMIFKAIEFATKAHGNVRQYRKGTNIPYIIHPLGVAKILIDHRYPDHMVIAGILHDTIEDTMATLDQIKDTFGTDIADLVEAASEPHHKYDDWETRKKHTIESLKTLPKEAVILALADKLDNIRAIREDLGRNGEAVWSRFNAPKVKQRWYYESLVDVISLRLVDENSSPLTDLFRHEVMQVFDDDGRTINGQ